MNFQLILCIFIICEAFELFYVQKGNTVSYYIANLLLLYKRGIVQFLCLHPSFYVAIFAVMYFDGYNALAVTLIMLKALDIVTKLVLLQKIENGESLGMFFVDIIERDANIPLFAKISVSLFYMVFFYLAFSLYA
jgi:hypothetical protein